MQKTLGLISLLAAGIAQAAPSNEELQTQINELRAQLEATASAVESNTSSAAPVKIGGYGELHYNNSQEQSGKDQLDLHRFVLFVSKEIDAKTRFFSELEVEHNVAGEGKKGEVEVEQAFIEHDLSNQLRAKAGVFLVPVGILNETHEPDTFYGVERNNVEKNIIPATWWEGGAGVSFKQGMTQLDVAYHSGLNMPAGKYKVRDARQKTSEAEANNFAYTARVTVTPVAGVSVGATYQYQEDIAQGKGVPAALTEVHAVVEKNGFGLRALYAQWDIDGQIKTVQAEAGAVKQSGYYLEPSYRVNEKVGVFARYSEHDNKAGDSDKSAINETDLGVNYWLAQGVVLKADYNRSHDTSKTNGVVYSDTLNFGMGYSF